MRVVQPWILARDAKEMYARPTLARKVEDKEIGDGNEKSAGTGESIRSIGELGNVGHGRGFALVGLHSCGDLVPTMLRVFAERKECKAVHAVSCCYMKLKTGRKAQVCLCVCLYCILSILILKTVRKAQVCLFAVAA